MSIEGEKALAEALKAAKDQGHDPQRLNKHGDVTLYICSRCREALSFAESTWDDSIGSSGLKKPCRPKKK